MIAKVLVICYFASAVVGGRLPYGGHVIRIVQVPSYETKAAVSFEEAPEPYQFQFENTDEDGNTISRSESGNANGVVTGSYGYKNAEGVYRQVEYVADASGFHPKIKTNEQGTATSAPADVEIVAEKIHVFQPVYKIVKIIQPIHGHYIHVPYYDVHANA
ncbi:cuticle protein 10.9-like [Tachypleus tridentatus]|uniref:cuticle protein 10.9-like n=1 Tax=Tachypleus tridentatus TaxID=6853 RepID=UPI003FD0A800